MADYISKSSGERYKRFIEEATVNLSQHMYDLFIEENCEHYHKAGIRSLIIRRQLARCCEWCSNIAGIYEYSSGEYPEEVFSRHENCRCLVTVKTEKGGYQNVWTKIEYKSQREARIKRQDELAQREDWIGEYFKARNIEEAGGKHFFDATELFNKKPKEPKAVAHDLIGKFEVNGRIIDPKDSNIVLKRSHSDKEEQAVNWWLDKYGGEIQWVPRVLKPQHVKTPDIFISGVFYDIKQPTGAGKWVIDHQVNEAKGQAENVLIDLTDSPLKLDLNEIKRQTEYVFSSGRYIWLRQLQIIADNSLLFAYERI